MLNLVTAPTQEPVSLADAKAHLRVDHCDEDALIATQIASARQMVENYTGRRLISQTWELFLDAIPFQRDSQWWDGTRQGHISSVLGAPRFIDLKLAPVSAITSFQSYDVGNAVDTFSSSNYFLDSSSAPSRLVLNDSATWPVNLRAVNAIRILFVAGYGTTGRAVPPQLIQAVKCVLATLYVNRGECDDATALNATARGLLDPYKIRRVT